MNWIQEQNANSYDYEQHVNNMKPREGGPLVILFIAILGFTFIWGWSAQHSIRNQGTSPRSQNHYQSKQDAKNGGKSGST